MSELPAPERPLSEDELHAYVDLQLDTPRRAVVEQFLATHADAAERVQAYLRQRQDLRAALAAQAAEPVPARLTLARLMEARLGQQRRSHWRVAAAALLGLGLGAGGTVLLTPGPPHGMALVAREAAASYRVFAQDRTHPVEIGARQREDLARWVSTRLDRAIAPPDLSASGYTLMGGRLVATAPGPAALFVFENERGARLTVFVRPMQGSRAAPMRQVEVDDLYGCAWAENGLGYAVIADESYRRLWALSQVVRQQAARPG